jgi:hypothetical protein
VVVEKQTVERPLCYGKFLSVIHPLIIRMCGPGAPADLSGSLERVSIVWFPTDFRHSLYIDYQAYLVNHHNGARHEHSLHVTVIAEGVEYREQLDYLLRNGCQKIQGFIYSPPVNANQFE